MSHTAIKVFGVPECLAAFHDLPRDTQNHSMRVAMNAGGGVIRDAAVANLPKETGLLRKSMKVKVRVPNASHNPAHWGKPAYAVIGPARRVIGLATTVKGVARAGIKRAIKAQAGAGSVRVRRPSRYAHLIERGTKPHTIKTTNSRVLSNQAAVFGRSVKHPGTQGKGFLSRAAASYGQVAIGKVQKKLQEGIAAWAKRRSAKVTPVLVGA